MSITVLLIGMTTGKHNELLSALTKKYNTLVARSGKLAHDKLKSNPDIKIIVLNAYSMNTSGNRVAHQLKQRFSNIPLIHIYQNVDQIPSAKKRNAEIVLYGSISGRRLTNNVERLLNTGKDEMLTYGPFTMNVTRKILVAHDKETQLTPKQALLIEMFLRSPEKIIARKQLMENVWKTDYLGDTRTLDVHIRWIRKIMEKDSKKPCYLKTIRGIGYQLVLPQQKNPT